MTTYFRRVTIIRVQKPQKKDLNQEIQWFSNTLGLFSQRDKEKSKFRVFLELLKAAKNKKPLSSEQISQRTDLSRATVLHHIEHLMEGGVVIDLDGKYMLRVNNLEELVAHIQKDIFEIFKDLKEMAEELDRELELLKE